MKMYIV